MDNLTNEKQIVNLEKLIKINNPNGFSLFTKLATSINKLTRDIEENGTTKQKLKLKTLIDRIEKDENINIMEILDQLESIKKTTKNLTDKKLLIKKPTLKYNENHGSMISSPLAEALTTNFKPERVSKANKEIYCNEIKNSAGVLSMIQEDKTIDNYDLRPESEILNNYTTIGLSREELQLYLILVNLYLENIPKKNYGKTLKVDVKFLHNKILKKQNRLRQEDMDFYRGIFARLSTKRLTYKSTNAINIFKQKRFKNVEIDSNLIQIGVMTNNELKEQLINITPTDYTLLELKEIKQFNNFVPTEFYNLDFRKEFDNILFFGICLCNMHRNNATSKDKNDEGKQITIKNKSYMWEIDFVKLVNKSLPHAEHIIDGYEKEKNSKKRYIESNIENPLIKAIEIMIKNNYIINFDFNKLKINYRKAFQENNKIKFIFNYDVGKLIKIDKN
jgi:hypothetical protein